MHKDTSDQGSFPSNLNLRQMSQMQATQSQLFKQKNLSRIKQQSPSRQQQSQQSIAQNQKGLECCDRQRIKQYLWGWVYFIVGFIVFLLIWVIGHFSIQRLTSYYYFNSFNVSPYTFIDFWKLSNRANNILSSSQVYVQSTQLYQSSSLKNGDAIVLSLLFSWVMWKLPLAVFTLKVIRHKKQTMLNYATWIFFVLLLLLIDIMATVFRPQGYQDWIYFVVYFFWSIVLVVVNGIEKKKRMYRNLVNFLLPILYIVVAYACFTILIPGIYHSIYNGINNDAPYIIVHIFPIIDLIFYSLIIIITYYTDSHIIKFTKMLYFLNTGYAVGHVILFSPEDVEFYYLVVYLVIRNFVFNWILQRVQKYVINPVSLPGWIIVYLVSLAINFIPFTGLGKLVLSISFYTQLLQLTLPIQSYALPQDYFAYSASTLPQIGTYNPQLNSNIQLSSVFIVWVLLSISQKYHISKIEIKQLFFNIFGIYLFYFGLVTAIQLYYLQLNSL